MTKDGDALFDLGLPSDDQRLSEAYARTGRTLDDLPYTPEFDRLAEELGATTVQQRRDLFHRLHNLRKAAKLPRLGKSSTPAVKVTADEEALLERLVIERVGTLGQRDRLPYDPRIDDLAQVFNQHTGRSLTQHDIWRLIAKIAK